MEAWTIGEDGLPAPKTVVGTGPKAFEVSIAAISPTQVVTAAGDSKHSLWVNTWEIDGAGVKPLDQVETKTALSTRYPLWLHGRKPSLSAPDDLLYD